MSTRDFSEQQFCGQCGRRLLPDKTCPNSQCSMYRRTSSPNYPSEVTTAVSERPQQSPITPRGTKISPRPNPNTRIYQLVIVVLVVVLVGVVGIFLMKSGQSPQPLVGTPTPAITITSTVSSRTATPQQINVSAGVSQSVLAGDCVDTFDFANIHAKYTVVFDHGPSKRAKITEDGTVVGTATIYRNSGCYSS